MNGFTVEFTVPVHIHTSNASTHSHAHPDAHTVVIVDGRPQGVGRQPVSQAEAQSNHFEMNTLEDSQTTTSNTDTHREWEFREIRARQLLAVFLCRPRPSRKVYKTSNFYQHSTFEFNRNVFEENHLEKNNADSLWNLCFFCFCSDFFLWNVWKKHLK